MAAQTVYHAYRYFTKQITKEQLAKYTLVNTGTGISSAGAGIAGAIAGAAIGSLAFPGVGTIIGMKIFGWICAQTMHAQSEVFSYKLPRILFFAGGIVGAILAGTLIGFLVNMGLTRAGDMVVYEEEHFLKAQEQLQYKNALKILG